VASRPDFSTVSIATFEVVRSGFRRDAKRFSAAMDLQVEAMEQRTKGDDAGAAERLMKSANLLSELSCFEVAASSYRDLAALQFKLGDVKNARNSIRSGLLQVLLGSHVPGSGGSTIVPLFALQVDDSQLVDFNELLSQLGGPPELLASEYDKYPARGRIVALVDALVNLGESSELFLSFLEEEILNRESAAHCYRILARHDPARAARLLPRIIEVADPSKDFWPRSSLLSEILSASDPQHVYANLPSIVKQVGEKKRELFCELLLEVMPPKHRTLNGKVEFWISDPERPLLVIPECSSAVLSLAPLLQSSSFSEVKEKVNAATA